MANRKITKLGHTVKGALAAYIAPRLAADAAFKAGELDVLLKGVKPAPFKEQIPLIADSVKTAFKERLAKDADVEDLAELLEALGGESDLDDGGEEMDDAKPKGAIDEDEGVALDEDANPGEELMQMLSKYDIPSSDLEAINGLISKLAPKPPAQDEFPPKKPAAAAPAKPAAAVPANAAPMKEVPAMKPALDRKTVDEIVNTAVLADRKKTQAHLLALFDAATKVKPYVGEINTLAFDSAEAIFKFALDSHQVPTKDVHPSAYSAMLALIDAKTATAAVTPAMAIDAASVQDFEKQYTHIPARA